MMREPDLLALQVADSEEVKEDPTRDPDQGVNAIEHATVTGEDIEAGDITVLDAEEPF